ncbi:hypothetical protein EJG51_013210 [Undibacterium piscinae]|uniref:LysR substrate-binding domain-containing protein n=1 Tax=Undibacterium piscinae TaxID=2495591 RepID=A0A6M4A659_9BURK|nr:hypothetical protein EJG51_013210 [Undibacterium piscinae]
MLRRFVRYGCCGADLIARPLRASRMLAAASPSCQALLAAAVSMGVVVQTDAMLEASIAAGHLVLLLPDWELPSRALHVVRRAEIRPSAKVRSFIDLVVAKLA